MPKLSTAGQLMQLIGQLKQERKEHEAAIAKIDATFSQLGLGVVTVKRGPGRPAAAFKAPKVKLGRKRRKYSQTANEFLIGLVKGKALTTKEVIEAWKKAGRKGTAANALSKLVKAKKITKQKIKGVKGSKYSA